MRNEALLALIVEYKAHITRLEEALHAVQEIIHKELCRLCWAPDDHHWTCINACTALNDVPSGETGSVAAPGKPIDVSGVGPSTAGGTVYIVVVPHKYEPYVQNVFSRKEDAERAVSDRKGVRIEPWYVQGAYQSWLNDVGSAG